MHSLRWHNTISCHFKVSSFHGYLKCWLNLFYCIYLFSSGKGSFSFFWTSCYLLWYIHAIDYLHLSLFPTLSVANVKLLKMYYIILCAIVFVNNDTRTNDINTFERWTKDLSKLQAFAGNPFCGAVYTNCFEKCTYYYVHILGWFKKCTKATE